MIGDECRFLRCVVSVMNWETWGTRGERNSVSFLKLVKEPKCSERNRGKS